MHIIKIRNILPLILSILKLIYLVKAPEPLLRGFLHLRCRCRLRLVIEELIADGFQVNSVHLINIKS